MKAANLAFAIYRRAIRPVIAEIVGPVGYLLGGCRAATPNTKAPTVCKHGRTGESARHYHL